MKDLKTDDFLLLDETIVNSPSFRKIMEDGTVTDEELVSQAEKVSSIASRLDEICNQEQKNLINELLAETGVLYMAYNINELQSLK